VADCVHCIVFARAPRPGRVKTRLAEFLGHERAAAAYHATLRAALRAASNFSYVVYCAQEDEVDELRRLVDLIARESRPTGSQPRVDVQIQGNLGDRMADALLREALKRHPDDFVCLIGSDLPLISSGAIERAARSAGELPDGAVLGPAEDGGYWLIGARASTIAKANNVKKSWFDSMEWSRPDVLDRQRRVLAGAGIQSVLAETLADIDNGQSFFALAKGPPLSHLKPDIRAILPVLNEAENLPFVLGPLRETGIFSSILCVDNGSTDGSCEIAQSLGAEVITSERGYGNACLAGIEHIRKSGGCQVVLFIDADGSDRVQDIWDVLAPVVSGRADFCLGRRVPLEEGALLFHARFGNWLSCFLMRLFWNARYQDLGPLRALGFEALASLSMEDRNFGWTVEMQIRALKKRLKILEIPVGYRKRKHGKSKVSASIRGSILAGYVILRTVFRELLRGGHGG
jgi:glycosyltransferase A (GT-A) superfamily protein (DUF2064 family)